MPKSRFTKAWSAKIVKRGEFSRQLDILGDDIVEAASEAITKCPVGWTVEGIEII